MWSNKEHKSQIYSSQAKAVIKTGYIYHVLSLVSYLARADRRWDQYLFIMILSTALWALLFSGLDPTARVDALHEDVNSRWRWQSPKWAARRQSRELLIIYCSAFFISGSCSWRWPLVPSIVRHFYLWFSRGQIELLFHWPGRGLKYKATPIEWSKS